MNVAEILPRAARLADGIAAYKRHLMQHQQLPVARQGTMSDAG
jgi:hypothetical protein